MEHKFQVGDRVKGSIGGNGTIKYLINSKRNQKQYIVEFDNREEGDPDIDLILFEDQLISLSEKPQPKYKVGDNVLAPAKIISAIDCKGEYLVGFENRLPVPSSFPQYDYYLEKHLRPLHDQPIKPEEVKAGRKVLIEGIIIKDGLTQNGNVHIRTKWLDGRGNKVEQADIYHPELVKLRHEDE